MTLSRPQILNPSTIIPPELYVERAADRQLARILNEMGRPGYVLVARQMGKTNLLLNAKRQMIGGPDAFIYVDVSNFVPDLRAFFRSVIDACVDSYPELFNEASESIEHRRSNQRQLLEHKEHEFELRQLLIHMQGRLVICLDEIDALTKTIYSDHVFSLIRSIYFSGRTNFPEFNRLTYVLSGVAEPTEIIKNRSISPFNIGEKIYLEDFSWDEFQTFLQKAQLTLTEDSARTVFSWAGGNPRISWDLCSALEAYPGIITPSVIDDLVNRIYLSNFDLPPVDHIRTLVAADKELRNAIISIYYQRSQAISDAVKSRLYLAGIISASTSNNISIKNKILENALSEKWLIEVERNEKTTLEHAEALYLDQRYVEALAAYEECEAEGVIEDVDFFALRKGTCQYYTGDFKGAAATLTKNPFPKSRSVDFYVACRSRIANAQLFLGNLEESIKSFEKLINEFGSSEGEQPLSFYQAKLNLSSAYLSLDPPNTLRVRELCESVILSVTQAPESDASFELLERYRCIAHYNICVAFLKNRDHDAARAAMGEAIEHAGRSDRATLLLERARKFEHGLARIASIEECANYCIANTVAITETARAERPLAFSAERAATLIMELDLGRPRSLSALERFLRFCMDSDVGHETTVHRVVSLAASFAFAIQKSDTAIRLYAEGSKLGASLLNEDYWNVLNFNIALGQHDQVLAFSEIYLKKVLASHAEPKGVEVRAAHKMVRALLSADRVTEADALLNAIGVREFNLERSISTFEELVDQFWRLTVDISLAPNRNFRPEIRALFSALSKPDIPKPEIYSPDYSRYLMGQLMSISPEEFTPKTVQRETRKIGRNDIVAVELSDGTVQKGKFKKLEQLIRGGAKLIEF